MTYSKLNSKQVIDLNGRAKIKKFTRENIGENLSNLLLGKDFLNKTHTHKNRKYERIKTDKLNFIKMKTSAL